MKTLVLLAALFPTILFSQIAEELRIQQRMPDNLSYQMRTFGAPPAGNITGFLTIDGVTHLPQYYIPGAGLTANTLTKTIDVVGKEPTITTGTSAQYYRGDKVWAAMPTALSQFTNDSNFVSTSSLTSILANYAETSVMNSALSGKFNQPSGNVNQYVRGDGSLATFPTMTSGTVTSVGLVSTDLVVSGSPVTTSGNITANLNSTGVAAGTYSNVTVDVKGRVTAASTRSFNNAPARSLVAVAAAANGFQVSSTRDAFASYSVTIGTAITLGGNSAGYCVLEIAATNSATAGDWKEIARVTSGQGGGVVVGISLTTTGGGPLTGIIPSGWYARIRSVNTTGTPTYAVNSGQEVLQ